MTPTPVQKSTILPESELLFKIREQDTPTITAKIKALKLISKISNTEVVLLVAKAMIF